jgi:RNA polymerase sigma factor (sigma-70 family)
MDEHELGLLLDRSLDQRPLRGHAGHDPLDLGCSGHLQPVRPEVVERLRGQQFVEKLCELARLRHLFSCYAFEPGRIRSNERRCSLSARIGTGRVGDSVKGEAGVRVEAMGMSDAAVLERPDGTTGPTDHQLVRAVRRGDDRAFEALYSRYQRRITAYVYGMVKDHGRAEDITQEIFVSALRRMRQTERPIAFKPWIYEIAKNACIDAYRRGRRAEEVSFDADDRLSPSDYGRLVATGPGPDAAVDAKQDLDHLCGAFGGLSDTHHQILVMRELEGLSYKDIGEKLGMSRPAVESTLFRARKRLGEEYDELASGARCLRIQGIIAGAGETRLGLRDQRKLARHVSHCQPCRRLAAQAGVDVALPLPARIADKIAALLPLPAFLRMRRGGGDPVTAAGGSGGGHGWAVHLPAFAEPLQTGWGKAAASLAALLVAGAGAGVTTSLDHGKRDDRGTGARPVVERSADAPSAIAPAAAHRPIAERGAGKVQIKGVAKRRAGDGRGHGAGSKSLGAGNRRAGSPKPASHPGNPASAPPAGAPDQRAGGRQTKDHGDKAPALPNVDTDVVPDVPAAGGAQQKLQNAVNDVDETVQNAGGNLDQTVQNTLNNTQQVLTDPQNLVPNVSDTANQALGDVNKTVGDAAGDLGNTVGGLLKP